MNGVAWKRLYPFKLPRYSWIKTRVWKSLGPEAQGGKKKKTHGKKAIPCRTSTEVSHKNNIMVCCVSSGQACLCHYTLTVCVNPSVWAAGVEANFKTNFIFVHACWSIALLCVCVCTVFVCVVFLYAPDQHQCCHVRANVLPAALDKCLPLTLIHWPHVYCCFDTFSIVKYEVYNIYYKWG